MFTIVHIPTAKIVHEEMRAPVRGESDEILGFDYWIRPVVCDSFEEAYEIMSHTIFMDYYHEEIPTVSNFFNSYLKNSDIPFHELLIVEEDCV